MFLSAADVQRLTGKIRFSAQQRALERLGIPFTIAATGEPMVRETALDAKPGQKQSRGHRWDRIGSIRNLRP